MKKLTVLILVLALVVCLFSGCAESTETSDGESSDPSNAETSASADSSSSTEESESGSLMSEPLTFKVAYVENLDTPIGQILPGKFEEITERTNGDLQFEIYPSAQLGNIADTLEQIANGAPIITTAGYDNMAAFVEEAIPCAIRMCLQH